MAINRFSVTPLGGFDLGGALGQLGQTFQRNRELAEQDERRQYISGLTKRASEGDADAVSELWGQSPQLAQMFDDRMRQLEITQGAEKARMMQEATGDFLLRFKGSSDESRKALLQEALADPNIDFDEEDFRAVQEGNTIGLELGLFNYMGKDAYDRLYAQPEAESIQTQVIQTPTGSKVINTQTGDTVKDIVNPEKKKQFELQQRERAQKIKEAENAEKQKIKDTQIKEQSAQEARRATVNGTAQSFTLAKELQDLDKVEGATGFFDRVFANTGLTPETDDFISKALQFKDSLTLENLSLMKGPLTDNDIKVLSSAASGLRIDEDGFVGSPKGIVNQISRLEKMLDTKLKAAVKRGDLSQVDYEKIKSGEFFGEVQPEDFELPPGVRRID
jgi:hypothetical protein